jgi:hypothetical protein
MRIPTALAATAGAALALSLAACESTASRSSASYAIVDGQRVETPTIKMGDRATINRIIDEGRNNSQVMDILHAYTVEMGPRLTGSTRLQQAQRWARDRFAEWGLANARLEQWGTIATRFDRGPSHGKVLLMSDDPESEPKQLRELDVTTLAWSRGTDGPVTGHAIVLPTTTEDYEANKGSYEGAWVMIPANFQGRGGVRSTGYLMRQRMDERHNLRNDIQTEEAQAEDAQTDENLAAAQAGHLWEGTFDYNGTKIPTTLVLDDSADEITGSMSISGFSEGPIENAYRDEDGSINFLWTHSMGTSNITLTVEGDTATGKSVADSGNEYTIEFTRTVADEISEEERIEQDRKDALAAVLAENPAGFVSASKDERVWTTSANDWRTRELKDYPVDVEVNVRQSDYDYIMTRIAEGMDIRVEFDMQNTLTQGPIPDYNVIAEIPGTLYPDEVVIISAHIDSWDGPGSMGTTDNGTGSAVMTEAARILSAVGAKPKRTIRVCLWSGEEQGLLGAREYVKNLTEEERAKISAAFVDDGGTNYQGGIPAADFMVDYLAAATAPTNGVFRSSIDKGNQLRDDDPDNDALAGYLNVNIRPTGAQINTHGGSDHAAFNAVGIPGFFWDESGRGDYGYTWHTQNDTFDEAIEEYLIQSATNMAITAYNLANAPGLLPREGETFSDTESEAK